MIIKDGIVYSLPPYDVFNSMSHEALRRLAWDRKLSQHVINLVCKSPYPEAAKAFCSQPGAEWLKQFQDATEQTEHNERRGEGNVSKAE